MTDERLRALERRFRESGREEDRRAWESARARAGLAPGVGLVFLDDLHAFATWISDRAPAWRVERGLDGPLLPSTMKPPPALVVVPSREKWDLLGVSASWLRMARAVVVLVEDPDQGELAREEIGPMVDWVVSPPGDRLEPAIDTAIERAGSGGGDWTWLEAPFPGMPAAPPGPWIYWVQPRLSVLAAGLSPGAGRPGMLDPAFEGHPGSEAVDLCTGTRTPVSGLPVRDGLHIVAASPDGRGWFHSRYYSRGDFTWQEEGCEPRPCSGGSGHPIGFDPFGRAAWAGHRAHFHWRVPGPDGPAYWTPSSHDWPCGHAKKLYGHEDNDPLWVHLSPDASACLSVYDHDALLTPGLPLRWRDLGSFALAERARGEPRALLFQRSHDPDGYPGDPLEADEDARDRRATVTLGPTPEARYAVGLEAPTWRLAGGTVTCLGGPLEEWIVCDAEHRERARHPGRLLAGWDRWVVVLEGDRLRRLDLLGGPGEELGPPGRTVESAVAIPGTPNAVLVSRGGDGSHHHIRLV